MSHGEGKTSPSPGTGPFCIAIPCMPTHSWLFSQSREKCSMKKKRRGWLRSGVENLHPPQRFYVQQLKRKNVFFLLLITPKPHMHTHTHMRLHMYIKKNPAQSFIVESIFHGMEYAYKQQLYFWWEVKTFFTIFYLVLFTCNS